MYKNVQEKIAQLELFNVSDIPMIPIPSKTKHNHDKKFENYLTRFIVRSKKGNK